jgi:uncharacterized protein (DUF885 family)
VKPVSELARDYWEGTLRAAPRWATQLGDHRFDDRLEDLSPAAKERERARLEGLRVEIGEARARDAEEQLTLDALAQQIASDLDVLACPQEEWTLDPLEGPQVDLLDLVEYQDADTPEAATAMLARWRAIGRYVDAYVANLERGLAANRAPVRDAAAKVLAQLDELLARPIGEWPLLRPIESASGSPETFAKELTKAVSDVVAPAFERLRAFVRDRALPRSRPSEAAGLCFVDGGRDVYRRLIRVHTSLELAPDEIHRIGLEEVARAKREIEALGRKLFAVGDLAQLRKKVESDPGLFFATRAQVREKAEATLRRAEAAVPAHFGRLPKTPCVVKPLEPHEEKYSTVAFYREPAADGSRPGTYLVNTYEPGTRARFEAQALAFHEAVPGHHLQIALAQELPLPDFRRNGTATAYVEGWALYAEQLADEIGLYDSDLDRIGRHSFDAWRACRLVVDTGLHALGWSRRRAIDFMEANTLLASNNVENEVDRYIVWPGQALAYKLGQLEIVALRELAKRELGGAFDLRQFHDRVLELGPVSLGLLRARIVAWVSEPRS